MKSFVNALQSHTPYPDGEDRPGDKPARRDATDGRALLDRILNTPGLEQVVPRLRPELLHRVIQTCGLEDCGEIVAMVTPEQLARIFYLDLWRAEAGLDEQFDAGRFGVWLGALLESGAAAAARKLAGVDVDLVVAGLAQHALVYDRAAVTPYETTDGELITFYADAISVFDNGLTFDLGGYLLVARRADSWEAIVEILTSLGEERPDYFHQVMRGCVKLSNSGREVDGLDDLLPEADQAMFDLAADREQRREKQGYVTPAQARAFLQMSRELRLGSDAAPPANPLARAYFQAIDETRAADAGSASGESGLLAAESEAATGPTLRATLGDSEDAVAAVYEILSDAGILAPPRLLPGAPEIRAPRLGQIRTRLEFALDHDRAAWSARNQELAYLANTLMAGCSIQARPFTAQEASDAAIAICNLGLENWPSNWLPANATAPPISFLIDHDLIGVFQVGWTVLHCEVGMYAAEQLIAVLEQMRSDDREIQAELDTLRLEMAKHWRAGSPWRARDALDVIATLDLPAWAVLLALIDECPALHAAAGASQDSRILSISATDLEFISENSQIACIHEFMRSLPETLS